MIAVLYETARKEIEVSFRLVKAGDNKKSESIKLTPVAAQKLHYGKVELKSAMSNVLAVVIDQYKYSSLPQLNGVLKLFNVQADKR